MPPPKRYKVILKPSVNAIVRCGKLLIGTTDMAEFLGVSITKVQQLVFTDRIPLPVRVGWGKLHRWNVLELLDWVQAGCPRRGPWIEMHGWSGWARR